MVYKLAADVRVGEQEELPCGDAANYGHRAEGFFSEWEEVFVVA